jgi:DNA polymerase-1
LNLDDVRVTLIDSVDDCFEFMRWLSTKSKIAFDTETTGLDVDVDRVRLVQFGDERHGWVVPFERWSGLVHEVLRRYEGRYVAHNAPYDVAISRKHDLRWPVHRIDDTRLKLHVIDATGSLALKNAAKRLVDPRADAGQRRLDEALGSVGGWTWETIPYDFEPYWFYAGLDTVLTYQLDDVIDPQVRAEAPRSYELELAVAWVTEKMERRGVKVDREYTAAFIDRLNRYANDVEAWAHAAFGIYVGSQKELPEALLREGVELTKRTGTGMWCVDKDVLGGIEHPLAQAALGRRQAVKIVSTYLEHFLELSQRDGRVHASINSVGGTARSLFESGGSGRGVRTGRMSISRPSLQNVPTRTKEGRHVRDCFVAEEEHTWVKVDADQIEMRLLAHLAREPKMIEAFVSEGDFFVNLAKDLFADPHFQKSDPRRQLIKNGGYAKIYGAGIDKFAKTAGAPFDEAAAFMRRFDALYPGVPRFVHEVERVARQRLDDEGVSYVRSPLTGRRHVADPGKLYPLVNYLIQGTAGEILKLKAVEADQAGLSDYMMIPVHDEFDLEVPNDRVDETLDGLRDVLNDDQLLRVPLTWSITTGKRWGECS